MENKEKKRSGVEKLVADAEFHGVELTRDQLLKYVEGDLRLIANFGLMLLNEREIQEALADALYRAVSEEKKRRSGQVELEFEANGNKS